MDDHEKTPRDLFGMEVATKVKRSDTVAPKTNPASMLPDETYMTVAQVAKRYQVSKSTIWRWAEERKSFPTPFEITEGTTRWALSDLVAFDRNLRRKRSRTAQKRGH